MAIRRMSIADGVAAGSFFYFSGDNKYLVKTISASERRTLRRILRDYVAHFQNNRHSLLSRIYGLYKLKLDDTTSTFVIMGNVFNPAIPVHQRFDLKVPARWHDARAAGPHSRTLATILGHSIRTLARGRRRAAQSVRRTCTSPASSTRTWTLSSSVRCSPGTPGWSTTRALKIHGSAAFESCCRAQGAKSTLASISRRL